MPVAKDDFRDALNLEHLAGISVGAMRDRVEDNVMETERASWGELKAMFRWVIETGTVRAARLLCMLDDHRHGAIQLRAKIGALLGAGLDLFPWHDHALGQIRGHRRGALLGQG